MGIDLQKPGKPSQTRPPEGTPGEGAFRILERLNRFTPAGAGALLWQTVNCRGLTR